MDRHNSSTDLFTLLGMMATIAGIVMCLVLLFTPATFGAMEAPAMIDRASDLHLSMRWIQPILGRGIVEDAVIRQRSADAALTWSKEGSSKPAQGSIQWVLGRVIVELNRSRMISGLAGRASDDAAIAAIVRHAAEQFEDSGGEVSQNKRVPAPHNVLF